MSRVSTLAACPLRDKRTTRVAASLFVIPAAALLLLCACAGSPLAASSSSPPLATVKPVAAHVAGTLTVFAAASLTESFNEMKTAFEGTNPGTTVNLNLQDSQALRGQLVRGAPADIFASADTLTMDGAMSDGTVDGTPSIFAHNRLAVVVLATNTKVATLQGSGHAWRQACGRAWLRGGR
jgi:molybdate transport system substrate-binding protein